VYQFIFETDEEYALRMFIFLGKGRVNVMSMYCAVSYWITRPSTSYHIAGKFGGY